MKETYEAYAARKDCELAKLKYERWLEGNKYYNKGLLKGLGIRGIFLYPLLKRPEK